jgi:hypothetical protein
MHDSPWSHWNAEEEDVVTIVNVYSISPAVKNIYIKINNGMKKD